MTGEPARSDRAPVFDAIRALRGKGFSQMEVAEVDDLLDRLGILRLATAGPRLGALSERYESGGRGPGTVSSGAGDPGGVSYGTYQLASRTGTMAAFLSGEGQPWAGELPIHPGSPGFTAAWKAIAAREPERFGAAQHAFIERTHYRPVVAAVLAATGLDCDSRAQGVRDAVWSCAVQHGKASKIVSDAVRAADQVAGRGAASYDRLLVNAIYDVRCAYVRALRDKARPAEGATFQSILDNRYPDERRRALEMVP